MNILRDFTHARMTPGLDVATIKIKATERLSRGAGQLGSNRKVAWVVRLIELPKY